MGFRKSKLSSHATERLKERFRITPEQFLELLNTGQGKKIGTSSRSHLAHRMLWSHIDEQLLVAIQDVIDGTVITVLTVEMYGRDYGSNVTGTRIQKVKNMMVHAGLAPSSLWKPDVPGEYVTVYADLRDTAKRLALGRWKGEVRSVCLRELGEKSEFWTWVASRVAARGALLDHVVSVKARFSRGDVQDIPYAC